MSEEDDNSTQIDCDAISQDALRRSRVNVVKLLEPDAILDQFLEADLCGESTVVNVRDIRDARRTSDKNREICDVVARDPGRYAVFKQSLFRSSQLGLLDLLETAEKKAHAEMIDKGGSCCCSPAEPCPLIESLHCKRDLPECVSRKIKVIQRKLIDTYKDKCLTTPVYPLIKNVTEKIDSLYVKPTMQIVDVRGKQLGLNSKDCGNTSQKDMTVKSYEDIFQIDNKSCKNIYITGDAGVGKSTFCENLVDTWCRAHARSQEQTRELSDNEHIMTKYPLLFYISLRYALEDITIAQMIERQLDIDNAQELLEIENCLVVLDGLDEWTVKTTGSRFVTEGLPQRTLKGNYTVITTTRPWKLEKLELQEYEIDNQINITGLSKLSVEDLSGRILNVINKTHQTQKQVSEFIACAEKSKLHDQLKTPVILKLMVCLWYYGVCFGKSECELYSKMIDKQIELVAKELKDLNIPDTSESNDTGRYKNALPGCFKSSDNCKRYAHVLLPLSKLAFDILFKEDRGASLVLNDEDTSVCGMSSSDMDICLKIGILTQNKVLVNHIKESKSISFVHKTHQEFFAALHLATLDHDSDYNLLTLRGKRPLETFLEMSKVILFLNGMNDKLGNKVLSHVRDLACEDRRLADYRISCIGRRDKNFPLVKRVQYLIIDCENERHNNDLPRSAQQIDDVVATNSNRLRHLMKYWDVLRPDNVRSVSIHTRTKNDDSREVARLWNESFNDIRSSNRLQKLYIYDEMQCMNVNNIYMTVTETNWTLTCLVLCFVDVSSLGERFRDVLKMPRLRTLGLGDFLHLTHDQINFVCEFLHDATYIEELRLKHFDCLTHPKGNTDCKIEFDASRNQALRRLFVAGHIDKMLINTSSITLLEVRNIESEGITKELLECLRGSEKVSELDVTSKFPLDKAAMVDIIPVCEGLRQLRLASMNFADLTLMLPTSMTQLEHVLLRDITINNSSLLRMLDNLPAQRVEFWLGNVNIIQDDDSESVKYYIRTSHEFEVTLDDPTWMYFHTVR